MAGHGCAHKWERHISVPICDCSLCEIEELRWISCTDCDVFIAETEIAVAAFEILWESAGEPKWTV